MYDKKRVLFLFIFFAQQVKQSGVPYKNILIYIQHLAARATNTIMIIKKKKHIGPVHRRERERNSKRKRNVKSKKKKSKPDNYSINHSQILRLLDFNNK